MTVKAYYDGSGKDHDPRCRFVTLAGYVATDENWPCLESSWSSVLNGFPLCPQLPNGKKYFHCAEAFNLRDGFSAWTPKQVKSLAYELVKVLANQGRMGLIGLSCTVSKADYRKVKIDIPSLRPIENICLDHCIGNSFRHEAIKAGSDMEIFFDKNEEFCPILLDVWKSEFNGNKIWWADCVSTIAPVRDMREVPAIQAADLLAWVANRYYTHGPDDEYGRLFFSIAMANIQCHLFYDELEFRQTFFADGSMRTGTGPSRSHIKAPTGTYPYGETPVASGA